MNPSSTAFPLFVVVLGLTTLAGCGDPSDTYGDEEIVATEDGLRQPAGSPLRQFGFSTGPEPQSLQDFVRFYDAAKKVTGSGGLIRTGLTWDATKTNGPGFSNWSTTILEPALARGLRVLPSLRTRTSIPTDAEWSSALKDTVRMYGPGGTFAQSHPGFTGIIAYELWNEPNTTTGNVNGSMTPAKAVRLIKVGAAAIREEAKAMGFTPNVVGFAVGGIDLDYVKQLTAADANVWSYVDTLSMHAYMRYGVTEKGCNPTGSAADHCVKTFINVRDWLDSHGGAAVHLGTTEGGYSGSNDACRPPNVASEADQASLSEGALAWVRANPRLNFDFWINYHVHDGGLKMTASCNQFDPTYWKDNLGVARLDSSMKPWGTRFRDLIQLWR